LLLRVLRLRAALPRPLSRPRAAEPVRAVAEHPARDARRRARRGARRRRLPLPRVAAGAVPPGRDRDDGGLRRPGDAAAGPGWIGDRIGLARVIFFASFVYGGGLIVAGFPRHWHNYYFAMIFPVAVAAGMVMTLAWGLLFKLMPPQHRGAISGLATTTKGFGL